MCCSVGYLQSALLTSAITWDNESDFKRTRFIAKRCKAFFWTVMISKVKITDTTIKNLTNEQLDELVYNKAADLYLGTFGESFKQTENDELLKRLFAVTVLDSEVKNGGFDSFFRNSADLDKAAFEGLKVIGADKHADLFGQAIEIHQGQNRRFKDKRNPNFDPLDEQYYSLENVQTRREKFIRENINKFTD